MVAALRDQGAAALALWLVPGVAWACPYCAGRDDGGLAAAALMATMMALPFMISMVVIPAIRRVIAEPAVNHHIEQAP